VKHTLISQETIGQRIYFIRGHKIMIDKDLAELYGVSTKALNQAVKRNIRGC
jgi:ABC-type transporter Mla maintaining outer membrane lipid asymmetry ATPase subunit MlaF